MQPTTTTDKLAKELCDALNRSWLGGVGCLYCDFEMRNGAAIYTLFEARNTPRRKVLLTGLSKRAMNAKLREILNSKELLASIESGNWKEVEEVGAAVSGTTPSDYEQMSVNELITALEAKTGRTLMLGCQFKGVGSNARESRYMVEILIIPAAGVGQRYYMALKSIYGPFEWLAENTLKARLIDILRSPISWVMLRDSPHSCYACDPHLAHRNRRPPPPPARRSVRSYTTTYTAPFSSEIYSGGSNGNYHAPSWKVPGPPKSEIISDED